MTVLQRIFSLSIRLGDQGGLTCNGTIQPLGFYKAFFFCLVFFQNLLVASPATFLFFLNPPQLSDPATFWPISRALLVSWGTCNHDFASNHGRQHFHNFQSAKNFNPSLLSRIFIAWQCHQFLWTPPCCLISYLFLTFMKSRHFQRMAFCWRIFYS